MIEVERGASAFWVLIATGALSGALSMWTFRAWLDSGELRSAVNRILAHLFEFRLFADEPALILRAQWDLLAANGRLMKLVALPALLLVFPVGILLVASEAIFARAPLTPGSATVVTVQCKSSPGHALPDAWLDAPAGMDVETPPVRVSNESQISWRVRPVRASSGELRIRCDGRILEKTISSNPGLQWLSETRAGSIIAFFLHPFERPFSSSAIDSIAIRYPRATVFQMDWLVWFSIGSLGGALIPAVVGRLI